MNHNKTKEHTGRVSGWGFLQPFFNQYKHLSKRGQGNKKGQKGELLEECNKGH